MVVDISFIIPVFNSSKTLERCFDSVYKNKTDRNYEIVVVDDFSSDNSLEVLNNLKEKAPNNCHVEIIHLDENKGVQSTRFVGLKSSKGRYVYFLDSDDEIVDTFIDDVVEKMSKDDLDILLINTTVVCEDKKYPLIKEESFEHIEKYGPYLESLLFGDFGFICAHVFNRIAFEHVDLDALPHLAFTEDLNLYIEIAANEALKCGCYNKELYIYYLDSGWHVNKMNEPKSNDSLHVIKKRYGIIKSKYPEYVDDFKKGNLNTVLRLIHSVKKTRNIDRKDKKRILKKIYSEECINSVVRIKFRQFLKLSMKDKIRFVLYR